MASFGVDRNSPSAKNRRQIGQANFLHGRVGDVLYPNLARRSLWIVGHEQSFVALGKKRKISLSDVTTRFDRAGRDRQLRGTRMLTHCPTVRVESNSASSPSKGARIDRAPACLSNPSRWVFFEFELLLQNAIVGSINLIGGFPGHAQLNQIELCPRQGQIIVQRWRVHANEQLTGLDRLFAVSPNFYDLRGSGREEFCFLHRGDDRRRPMLVRQGIMKTISMAAHAERVAHARGL